jgi:hypothetical protein
MSVVSVEEAEARRRSRREDVQWNVARRDEAFRIADSIVGEALGNGLARLYFAYSNAVNSQTDTSWQKYHRTLRQLAEQNRGKLPALRKLWNALDVLPPKPEHMKGLRDASDIFKRVITAFMRAVFATEMDLRVMHHRSGGWSRKLREADGAGERLRDHPFALGDTRGALTVEVCEPYDDIAHRDRGFLEALAGRLDLECAMLPKELGMWFPGRTVPIVFYQRQGSYRPNIEAAIERMVQELGR